MPQPSRNLIEVLTNINSFIPPEEEKFKEEIEHTLNNVVYAPPEVMHIHWNYAQNVITKQFKIYKEINDIPEWGQKIIKIWTNRPTN